MIWDIGHEFMMMIRIVTNIIVTHMIRVHTVARDSFRKKGGHERLLCSKAR